jgi:hypothetical protein
VICYIELLFSFFNFFFNLFKRAFFSVDMLYVHLIRKNPSGIRLQEERRIKGPWLVRVN